MKLIQQEAGDGDSLSQPAGRAGQHSPSQDSQSVVSLPASQGASQPASQPARQAGRKQASQPGGSQPGSQPASQAARQPEASQPDSQPVSQPANEVVLLGVALLYESPGGNQVDGLPPVPTSICFLHAGFI